MELESKNEEDILREKIKAYRESLAKEKPELDFELLQRILDMVNESSEVKVAIDPIDSDGVWTPGTPTYAVSGVKTLEDDRIALRVSTEKHGIEAGTLHQQIRKALKRTSGSKVPVLFVHKNEVVKLTDVYSHALVRQVYAGLPSDVVLSFSEKKEATA